MQTNQTIKAGPDRLDLELYLDRLSRHEDRLCDEVAAARLRISWARLERECADEMTSVETSLLSAVGVIASPDNGDESALIARRARQIEAIRRMRELVEERLAELTRQTESVR